VRFTSKETIQLIRMRQFSCSVWLKRNWQKPKSLCSWVCSNKRKCFRLYVQRGLLKTRESIHIIPFIDHCKPSVPGAFLNCIRFCESNGRILKANLSWNPTRAKFFQLIASLSGILPELNLTKLKLEYLNSGLKCKKDMNTRENFFCITRIQLFFSSAQVSF